MATAHEGAPLLNQLRGSVPREKLVNLECSRVYEADTARVTICVSFFVAAVFLGNSDHLCKNLPEVQWLQLGYKDFSVPGIWSGQ